MGECIKENRVEFLVVSKELDDLLLKQEIFGRNVLESLSLNMGIRIQSFFTQRPHNEDGGILFKG